MALETSQDLIILVQFRAMQQTRFGGCKFITFEDKNWHSECFNCCKCNSSLVGRGFLVEDEGVVCPDCGA
ncbi:unnamed protein product [Mesocestoides corti]|uniref:LIM zinc-binding domain-containing protein n=1 Tax=Mesocestoides corti TaxID=53468 RepID=A0A0R3UA25_MESCO|nr:unnamed protein product [Mesocestoides corti]